MTPIHQLFAQNWNAEGVKPILSKADTPDEIMIYDAIGGFWGIQASDVVRELKKLTADTIHVRINSPGGEVDAARAIATAIAQHPSKVVAHVDGLAASSASFIILSADEIEISAGAFIMVHNPWSMTVGDAADHQATAELLQRYANAMANDYAKRTKQSLETVRKWMDNETWFSAEEAVAAGLADRVIETVAPKNQWNLSAYRNPPASLWQAGTVAAAAPTERQHDVQGSAPDNSSKEVNTMTNTTNTVANAGQTPSPSAEQVQAAIAAERSRVTEITNLALRAQMPQEAIEAAVSGGTSVEAFKTLVVDALCDRQRKESPETRVGTQAAVITRDETDTRRELMAAAILNRVNGATFKIDGSNEFKYMPLIRMAEESLVRAGVNTRSMAPNDIAIRAMHSTSDFPYVLENSLRKVLLNSYAMVEPSYRIWTKKSVATDFKTMRRIRRGDMPVFLEVPEGGEIQLGTIGEQRESYAIATYGRAISFTRQMIINDDLGAFNDLAGGFGEQAARLENKTVYAILTANAAMNDGVTLFHATHGNSGTGAIGNTGLNSMFVAMARQTGVDGVTIKNIKPKYLIVPPDLESTARTSQIAIGPNVKAADQNQFAGRLEVVSDGELTDTAKWYGASADGCIEYSHLAGAEGPQFVREENAGGILGVKFMAYLDFGAKATDWRGLYYSTGV